MAHVDRSFHMDETPEQAQSLFLRDVGPALAQDAEFLLQHEHPGELLFSEGDLGLPPGPLDEGLPFGNREIDAAEISAASSRYGGAGSLTGPETSAVPFRYRGGADGLARAFAAHIKATFTPDGDGTRVEVKGHAERALRDALDKLGTPGHWPETANDPHD